jgi:hypothetical protein
VLIHGKAEKLIFNKRKSHPSPLNRRVSSHLKRERERELLTGFFFAAIGAFPPFLGAYENYKQKSIYIYIYIYMKKE